MRKRYPIGTLPICLCLSSLLFGPAQLRGEGNRPSRTQAQSGAEPPPTLEQSPRLSSAPSSVEHAQQARLARRILWSRTERRETRAVFLPTTYLQATPFEEWPIGQGDREALSIYLDGWTEFSSDFEARFGKVPDRCNSAFEPDPPDSHSDASSLVDQILVQRQLTIVGNVIAAVEGLHVPLRRVATMVYVKVEDVVHDSEGRVQPGDILAFIRSTGGRIELASGSLCTRPPAVGFVPREGGQILVLADFIYHYDDYVAAMIVSPIDDGVIKVQQNAHLVREQTLSLDEILEAVSTHSEQR